MFKIILESLFSVAIVLGGILPYIPQYLDIRKARNSEGFSTLVCLILLIANTLRILFWFGHPFETPLLIQSILMNVVMLALVKLCVETRPNFQKSFSDFKWEDFWNWSDFLSYLEFLVTFTIVMSLFTFFFIESTLYVESLGLCALLTEAMLAFPQLLQNAKYKSTAGMSIKMVLLWAVGDIGKTIYFIVKDAPKQFWLCGFTQILIDLIIMIQVFMYRSEYHQL